jgi:hypothetical protein
VPRIEVPFCSSWWCWRRRGVGAILGGGRPEPGSRWAQRTAVAGAPPSTVSAAEHGLRRRARSPPPGLRRGPAVLPTGGAPRRRRAGASGRRCPRSTRGRRAPRGRARAPPRRRTGAVRARPRRWPTRRRKRPGRSPHWPPRRRWRDSAEADDQEQTEPEGGASAQSVQADHAPTVRRGGAPVIVAATHPAPDRRGEYHEYRGGVGCVAAPTPPAPGSRCPRRRAGPPGCPAPAPDSEPVP